MNILLGLTIIFRIEDGVFKVGSGSMYIERLFTLFGGIETVLFFVNQMLIL